MGNQPNFLTVGSPVVEVEMGVCGTWKEMRDFTNNKVAITRVITAISNKSIAGIYT